MGETDNKKSDIKLNKTTVDGIGILINSDPRGKEDGFFKDFTVIRTLINKSLARKLVGEKSLTSPKLITQLEQAILAAADRIPHSDNSDAQVKLLQEFSNKVGFNMKIPSPAPLITVDTQIDEIIKDIDAQKVGGTFINDDKDKVKIQVKKELLTELKALKNQQPSAKQVTDLLNSKVTYLNDRGCKESKFTNVIRNQHNNVVTSLGLNIPLLKQESTNTSSLNPFTKKEVTEVDKRKDRTAKFISEVKDKLDTAAETMGLKEGSPERDIFNNFLKELKQASLDPDATIEHYSDVIHKYEPQMEKLAPGIMNWVKNKVNEVCGTDFSVEKEGFSKTEDFVNYKQDMEIPDPDSDKGGPRPS